MRQRPKHAASLRSDVFRQLHQFSSVFVRRPKANPVGEIADASSSPSLTRSFASTSWAGRREELPICADFRVRPAGFAGAALEVVAFGVLHALGFWFVGHGRIIKLNLRYKDEAAFFLRQANAMPPLPTSRP